MQGTQPLSRYKWVMKEQPPLSQLPAHHPWKTHWGPLGEDIVLPSWDRVTFCRCLSCPISLWGPETSRGLPSHFSWNCTSSHYLGPFFPHKSAGHFQAWWGDIKKHTHTLQKPASQAKLSIEMWAKETVLCVSIHSCEKEHAWWFIVMPSSSIVFCSRLTLF